MRSNQVHNNRKIVMKNIFHKLRLILLTTEPITKPVTRIVCSDIAVANPFLLGYTLVTEYLSQDIKEISPS